MTISPAPSSILGTRVARIEDPRLIRGQATYTADLSDPRLDGALHAVFLRSPLAHARIRSIDVTAARVAPGVAAVLISPDLGLPAPEPDHGIVEPYLADGVVRYVGQAIAIVLAESEAAAMDAAELIAVDYEPLPAVATTRQAATDATVLFPELGTNIAASSGAVTDGFFDGCEVVVSRQIVNNRVAPAPMEGRAGAAVWGRDEGGVIPGDSPRADAAHLTMWLPNQGAQLAKRNLVEAFALDAAQVTVITPDVGGAFGAKFGAEPDHIVIAAAARIAGRPVRWAETRSENLTGMTHGRAQHQTVTVGGTRDGRMIAYRLEVDQDAGAYPRLAVDCVEGTALMAPGVYAFERCEVMWRAIMTTTTPVGAFRGAGRPEATAAIERAVDLFAAEIGIDAAEVRRINMIPAFAAPRTSLTGAVYDSGDYPAALQAVLQAAGYDDLRTEQVRRQAAGSERLLGLGLSTYVEITGGGKESARVQLLPDGGARIFTGVSPHGQGHATAFAMIVSDLLGVPVQRVELVWGDTDLVPRGGGTGGSRSLQLGGSAAHGAAVAVAELAKERAAALWEASVADLVVDTARGGVAVAGVPGQFATFAELAVAAELEGSELAAGSLYAAEGATFPFGAHLAVVEVDSLTGAARLQRLVAADDAGRVLNPLLAEGQRHGGLAQGVAQALYEEASYDDDGNPTAATFADYHLPTAADLPSFELLDHETATPYNVLGAKGLGEAATIGATPAVQNAVIDAVAHLGVRHIDMPLTPARVWAAIQAAAR